MNNKVPMMKPSASTVDEDIARMAYEEYAAKYGTSQSFEQLHQRGGFCAMEIITFLYARIQRLESSNKE
jgi:hypothetical protein